MMPAIKVMMFEDIKETKMIVVSKGSIYSLVFIVLWWFDSLL